MRLIEALAFQRWICNPGSELIRKWIGKEEEFLKRSVQGGKILDVGVGTGRVLKLLSNKGELYGVDIDPRMVKIAKNNIPDAHIMLADARWLPFPSSYFDYVLCVNNTLGNIRIGKIRVLKEMNRVLKPEGMAIVSVYHDTDTTLKERLKSYRYVGLKPQVFGSTTIAKGLYSEQFSTQRLTSLLIGAGISEFDILELTEIGLVAIWRKI